EVHPDDAVPHGVAGLVERGEVVVDPGDVRQAVDPVARGGDDAVDPVLLHDIGGHGGDGGVGLGGGERLKTLLGEVDGDHATAFAGHAGGDGGADARCGAGDDHGPARESCVGGRRGGFLGDRAVVDGADHVVDGGLGELALAEGDQLLQGQGLHLLEGTVRQLHPGQQFLHDGGATGVVEPAADGGRGGQCHCCSPLRLR